MNRLTLAALSVLVLASSAAAQKPNVIVFLADDMGIGDTSAYLGKKLETSQPALGVTLKTVNMERLAQMGTTFTHAYTPSSMCSTTRYGLLTGRYAWRSNMQSAVITSAWTNPEMIDPDRPTIATMFKNADYDTAMIGKWHMGVTVADVNGDPLVTSGISTINHFNNARWPTADNPNVQTILSGPRQHGFDYYYGPIASNDPIPGNIRGYFENETLQGVPIWTNPGPGGGFMPVVPSFDISKTGEVLGNKLLDLIDSHAGVGGGTASDKPLFTYFASNDNHSIHSPPASITLQGQTYDIANKARLTNGFDQNPREDTVYENDIVLGALMDKLQNTIDPQTGGPMIDNTLLIFTSDNGSDHTFFIANAGLRGHKQEIYEGGFRVPFIAAWPGQIPQGAVSDQAFQSNDLYATLAELTGQSLGSNVAEDSQNVLPALLGQTPAQFQRPGDIIVHDNTAGNTLEKGSLLAIRSGNYKLIVTRDLVNTPGQGAPNPGQSIPLALYDLDADWHEDTNLVADPAYASIVAELQQKLLKYRNQGFTRSTIQPEYGSMVRTDGGADLANNLNGSIGYEFTVGTRAVAVTRLGMWDDGDGDVINQETNFPNPDGDTIGSPDGLATPHFVRLFDKTSGLELANVEITDFNSALQGEFRYVNLSEALRLDPGHSYALTMSVATLDGDLFHLPAPFSGESPITSSTVGNFLARRALSDGEYPTMLPNGSLATGAADESVYAHRLYVGPTLTLIEVPGGGGLVPVDWVDFDFDGDSDGNDFLIWQRNLGATGVTRAEGDADGNGVVDGLDLDLWRSYAEQGAGSQGASQSVPEPAAGSLLAAVLAVGALNRRRHSSAGATRDFAAYA